MRLTTEEIREIIKEELSSFLMEKETIKSKNDQNWEILLYSKEADRGDKSIKSIMKRQRPKTYGEEHRCRSLEGTTDPSPRHVMITPAIMIDIRNLTTSRPKKFKQSDDGSGYVEYLRELQAVAIAVAKDVWPQINQYFRDPNLKNDNHYIYARYNCTDDFGKMMTYLEADKGFV